jgi:uncharacterized membrane protein
MRQNPLFLLTVLSLLVVASEHLVRRTSLSHIGTALLVIILGAIASNSGIIPASSTEDAPVVLYDVIFSHVAPIAIFWLLLQVNLRDVLKAGLPLVGLFLVGSVGTVLGAVLGMRLVGSEKVLGALYGPLAGMFAGTYTGGSVNFNAVALEYEVVRDGVLYGGAVVADNIVTALWIGATLAIPRLFSESWLRAAGQTAAASTTGSNAARPSAAAPIIDLAAETETLDPRKLALVLALGSGGLILSQQISAGFATVGITVPSILVITTVALVLAQVPGVSRIPGTRMLGMYAVYIFLAVIGAFCDLRAIGELGTKGLVILAFALVVVLVHGALLFGVARIFRMDLSAAAVASQANVGGSTSALALAKSLGREDLLLPGILLGALGNAIGTFLGFAVVQMVT